MMLLMCHTSNLRFALAIDDVVEVVGRATFEPIPAAPSWVAGAFVHRGVVTPVIDVGLLTGVAAAKPLWSSRVIVLKCQHESRDRRVGLLFERAFAEQVSIDLLDTRATKDWIWPWGPTLIDEKGTYCLLDIPGLLSLERQAILFPGTG